MKVTNKANLPAALVDLVQNSQFGYKEKCYSATTLLHANRDILLTRRHFDEIEVDANESVNMILGTAVHSLIEKFDKTGYAEIYLKEEIRDGYYLTGQCDLYDAVNFELVDWKTASVYKIIRKDFGDWKKQGLIYAWLLVKKGHFVKKLKFHALLKDWTARDRRIAKMKGDFYPDAQIYTWEYEVTAQDLRDIETFIRDKFDSLILDELLSDDQLPDCGPEDTWYTGDKYAVYGKSKVKAMRVLDTEQEAKDYMEHKGGTHIEFRPGEHRKCQDYCQCCKFCKYYQERKAKEMEEKEND